MRKIKLKYGDHYIEDITPGTSLYEISKLVQKDFSFPIVGAKLNHLIVDLSTLVTENAEVQFLDRSDKIGNRIYGRSLEFLVILGAKRLFGDKADVFINYSLDNGIYCEIEGIKINKNHVEKLEDEMKAITRENLVFTKSKVSRFEAIKYFSRNKQLDKVKNLNYTSNSTVDLHKLNDVYDYFFGPLVYDTSQISRFKLNYLGHNSFVMSYPSVRSPHLVTKYKHHEKVFMKYKEYQEWGKMVDLDMVADLNSVGASGSYKDVISLFETYYNNQLSHVAEEIYKNKSNIKIVLISGPSSSGKTTTTKKLAMYLRAKGLKPHQISLDDYYVDRVKTPKDENGNYDYASIKATDTEMFNNHLKKLLNGERVNLPRYDFVKGKKVFENRYLKIGRDDILLIEGIHTLNPSLTKSIPRINKYKIYTSPIVQMKIDNHNRVRTTDLRKLRRIVRDSKYRGIGAESTLLHWDNVDKEAYENIYPYQDDVDIVINSALSYEIGVLRIYAEPLLYGIKSNSEVYGEAIRLINLLRQFLPISSEDVPKDSILREFIGGSIYD